MIEGLGGCGDLVFIPTEVRLKSPRVMSVVINRQYCIE